MTASLKPSGNRMLLPLAVACVVIYGCGPAGTAHEPDAVLSEQVIRCGVAEVSDRAWFSSGKKALLFSGMDNLTYPVSTASKNAQDYFNQGLLLSFAFNHAEAARSFFEVTRQDSTCAMGWWGLAYVLGPNYNSGMEKDNFVRAYEALQNARRYASTASPKERDLIHALESRYSNDSLISRSKLDSAFAVEMRKLATKYPGDVTITTLTTESLMDLHPWNLWKKDGSAQPWTAEIVELIRHALILDPLHAGANHFNVHIMEMSADAAAAMTSADLLRNLVPGSGHMVHMPSHIYIRTGRYHDGVLSNQQAANTDSLYLDACHAQGIYPLAYYPHNYHFLAACATLDGESRLALHGALATARHAATGLMTDPAWATLQHYYTIPLYVETKFGMWDKILQSSEPEGSMKYPSVIWHYARGMAMLAKQNIPGAKAELVAINFLMQDTSLNKLTIWGINNLHDLCSIASTTLEGELLAKQKNYPAAIKVLKNAVTMEDALNYNEPPDWFFSIRHHLGAVLIEAGNYVEAIAVYKEDLLRYPHNGWAYAGLVKAYGSLHDTVNLATARAAFATAWKYADITLSSSRIL